MVYLEEPDGYQNSETRKSANSRKSSRRVGASAGSEGPTINAYYVDGIPNLIGRRFIDFGPGKIVLETISQGEGMVQRVPWMIIYANIGSRGGHALYSAREMDDAERETVQGFLREHRAL